MKIVTSIHCTKYPYKTNIFFDNQLFGLKTKYFNTEEKKLNHLYAKNAYY